MLVNLIHRDGGSRVIERIDEPVEFEGSGAQEGVLVTFPLEGRDVTGRIIEVVAASFAEPAIEVELVDRDALDAEAVVTLANLPRKDDFSTEL